MIPVCCGHARPGASADVVVEARPARPRALVEEVVGAGSDREDPRHRIQRVPDRPGVPVRPEVADLLPLGAPQDLRARPLLPHRERQVGIGLVVAVPDVEPGQVLLDQVELEHQRVDLAGRDDPLDARSRVDHGLGPGMEGSRPVVGEALPQGAGLADVDDPPVLVPEEVGAGRVRDAGRHRLREAHRPIVAPGGDPAGSDRDYAASTATTATGLDDGEGPGHRRGVVGRTGRSSPPASIAGTSTATGSGPGTSGPLKIGIGRDGRLIGGDHDVVGRPRVLVVEVDGERLRRRRDQAGRVEGGALRHDIQDGLAVLPAVRARRGRSPTVGAGLGTPIFRSEISP